MKISWKERRVCSRLFWKGCSMEWMECWIVLLRDTWMRIGSFLQTPEWMLHSQPNPPNKQPSTQATLIRPPFTFPLQTQSPPLVLYLLLLLIQKCTQNALYPKRDMPFFALPLGFKTLRWTVFSIALHYASHLLPLNWRLTKGRLGCPVRLQLSTFWLWKNETLM